MISKRNLDKNKNELIIGWGGLLLEPEACVICGMSVGIVLLTIGLVVSFLIRFVAEATEK